MYHTDVILYLRYIFDRLKSISERCFFRKLANAYISSTMFKHIPSPMENLCMLWHQKLNQKFRNNRLIKRNLECQYLGFLDFFRKFCIQNMYIYLMVNKSTSCGGAGPSSAQAGIGLYINFLFIWVLHIWIDIICFVGSIE